MGQCCSRTEVDQVFYLGKRLEKTFKILKKPRINKFDVVIILSIQTSDLSREIISDYIYQWFVDHYGQMSITVSQGALFSKKHLRITKKIILDCYSSEVHTLTVKLGYERTGIDSMMVPIDHYYGWYKVFLLEECSVCMENECQVMEISCGHQLYCLECYLDLIRRESGNEEYLAFQECPQCRQPCQQLVYQRSDHELDAIQIP